MFLQKYDWVGDFYHSGKSEFCDCSIFCIAHFHALLAKIDLSYIGLCQVVLGFRREIRLESKSKHIKGCSVKV